MAPYSGTIIWPGMTAPAMMDAGGTAAANLLSSRGYMASFTHDMTTMRTRVLFYEIGSPPAPGVPMGVRVDWLDAYNAIPAVGQQNGGVADVGNMAAAAVGGARLAVAGEKAQDGKEENGVAVQQNGEGKKGESVLQMRKAHARAVVAGAA